MAQARSAQPRGAQEGESRASRVTESRASRVTEPGSSVPHANEVRLVGRLAASATIRSLPSGDELVSFRLVVERRTDGKARPSGRTGVTGRGATVDAIECVVWRRGAARALLRAQPGDVLEVTGALRRRFWRGPSGAASRTEVDVAAVRRLRE